MTAMLGIFVAGAIIGGGFVALLFLWLDCKYGPYWGAGEDPVAERKRAEWESYLAEEEGRMEE